MSARPELAHVCTGAITASLACALLLGGVVAPAPVTEHDIDRLEPGALAGKRDAFRALFALQHRADGAVLESIHIVLGRTIRRCPAVFLQELRRHPHQYLDGILGNMIDLVDEYELQRRESRLRIAALQTVHDPELAELRDRCVARLQ